MSSPKVHLYTNSRITRDLTRHRSIQILQLMVISISKIEDTSGLPSEHFLGMLFKKEKKKKNSWFMYMTLARKSKSQHHHQCFFLPSGRKYNSLFAFLQLPFLHGCPTFIFHLTPPPLGPLNLKTLQHLFAF